MAFEEYGCSRFLCSLISPCKSLHQRSSTDTGSDDASWINGLSDYAKPIVG